MPLSHRMNKSNVKRTRRPGWLLLAGVLAAITCVVLMRFEGCGT